MDTSIEMDTKNKEVDVNSIRSQENKVRLPEGNNKEHPV